MLCDSAAVCRHNLRFRKKAENPQAQIPLDEMELLRQLPGRRGFVEPDVCESGRVCR